jgi:ADP-ribosylglycohydrolase
MKDNEQKDRVRGSLIGGAIGDALGFPVEFIYSYEEIQRRYGENGITRLQTEQWWTESSIGKAVISDDTQMTLFTALGLLNAKEKGMAPVPAICHAYVEWFYTQKGYRSKRFNDCWIGDLPEMNVRRAPGRTCISALEKII